MSDRFFIERIPADAVVSMHWRMVDAKTKKRYYLDSNGECEEQAQEILDIEAGRRPAPEPEEVPVRKPPRYEGLWRNGREIDLKTGLPKPDPEELFG